MTDKPEQPDADRVYYWVLRQGYRHCDIPACNCGLFHGGSANERLREIHEALGESIDMNGKTALQAIESQAARIAELEGALRELYDEQVDYITINHLGPPNHNRSMQRAYAALTRTA